MELKQIQQDRDGILAVPTSVEGGVSVPCAEKPGHTPGPWKTRKGFMDAVEIYPQRRRKRGQVGQPAELASVDDIYPEWRANARLIAAAPELLAALRNVRTSHQTGHNEAEAWRWVDAAIAKALGTEGSAA